MLRNLGPGAAILLAVVVGCNGRIGPPEASPDAPTPPDDRPAPVNDNRSPPERPPGERPPPAFEPLTPLTRRLSRDEFRFTVQDVLGVNLTDDDIAPLPEDRPLAGFARTASGLTTLPDHVLAYAEIADRVLQKPAVATFVDAHTGCTDRTRACATTFVASAGSRVLRRPLTDDNVTVFVDLFEAVAAENDFDRSVRAVLQAMLQSPGFLYLLEPEPTATATITGYAMASRLSYALWSSAPDAALYAAAEAGELDSRDGVVAQARRLLADDDKVRRGRLRFLADWARLESLPDEDGLRAELIASAEAFYADYVGDGGDLFGIFDHPTAYLTPALAEGWGVPSAGPGIRAYDTSALAGRRGLLAQPGIVAGMTNADGGAIVARGLFLQAQLFCSEPPDPPPSLQEIIEEFIAEQPEDASDRQIAEVRLARDSCGGCHRQFDPLAFGFEQFDFRGRYRTEDPFGNPVRVDGWIPGLLTGSENVPYADFETYMQGLGQTRVVQRCFVQRHLEYLIGRRLDSAQMDAIYALADATAANAGRLDALILAAVAHPLFRTTGPKRD